MLISKLYRQMYANTGIATDSCRAIDSLGAVARSRGAATVSDDADAGIADARVSPFEHQRADVRVTITTIAHGSRRQDAVLLSHGLSSPAVPPVVFALNAAG